MYEVRQRQGQITVAALAWIKEGGCSAHTGVVGVRLERMMSKRMGVGCHRGQRKKWYQK